MNIIFTGQPLAGKGTQAQLLGKKLNIPVFSIGALLREAYDNGDPKAIEGYENYAMKGRFLPISFKFYLLKEKLDNANNGFILENFPSTQEDLDTFNSYLQEKNLAIDAVINIHVSEEEMYKRMSQRGRMDDKEEIVKNRFLLQEKDRIVVTEYYRSQGKLIDIQGESSIEKVHEEICKAVNI